MVVSTALYTNFKEGRCLTYIGREGKAKAKQRVLVCLGSNHTHDHVLTELEAYAPLASVGSYCVVFDTIVEDLPAEMFPNHPWGPGNNPMTAV